MLWSRGWLASAFVWGGVELQVPRLPNFLLVLVALASFIRFSPTENRKRGFVSKQRGRKFGFARDDKVRAALPGGIG